MNKKSMMAASVLALSMAACGGNAAKDGAADGSRDASAEKVADANSSSKNGMPDKLSIYYGTTGPTAFDVPAKYQMAIGALLSNGQNFCTGTLIAKDVVLSAAHCAIDDWGRTMSTSGISFGLGTDMKNPVKKIAVKKIINNTKYDGNSSANDVALFILKNEVDSSIDYAPIPLNTASLSGIGLKGKIVQNVGFGSTENNDYNTKRFWTTEEVKALEGSYGFAVDGKGKSSVCFGDSGGPSLFVIDNQIRIVGTVSWGDQSCVDNDHYASTAANVGWINEQLAKIGHAAIEDVLIPQNAQEISNTDEDVVVENSCGDVTFVGSCEGNTAVWCNDGVIYERDCSLEGKVCEYSANQNGYYCVESQQQEVIVDAGCGDISYLGTCDGKVAKWCQDGEIKARDCSLFGQICDYVDSTYGYYCKDDVNGQEAAVNPCDEMSVYGVCNGSVAQWCNNGQLMQTDCSSYGATCGWVNYSYGYYCHY